MKLWNSDSELFDLARREFFVAVVGDVMDKLNLQHQFLPTEIQPLRLDMVVIGRAMPVLSVDVFAETGRVALTPEEVERVQNVLRQRARKALEVVA